MGYWQARSDLEFMVQFRSDVVELYKHESEALEQIKQSGASMTGRDLRRAIPVTASQNDQQGYQAVRAKLATEMTRAVRIAHQRRVPVEAVSYPAPSIGGAAIPYNLFEATLNDPSHGDGVDRQKVIDALNKTVRACEDRVRVEWKRFSNPLWWLWSAVSYVLRIPFVIAGAAGIQVDKFEASVGGILVKVVEAIVIVIVIAYVVAKLLR